MNKKPEKEIEPIPKGYHTVTPWIMSRNSDQLIKFIEAAFKGKEMGGATMKMAALVTLRSESEAPSS